MQRILSRNSNFSVAKLENEWLTTERYLHNICEYPYILGSPTPTRKKTLKPLAAPMAGDAPAVLAPPGEAGGAAAEENEPVDNNEPVDVGDEKAAAEDEAAAEPASEAAAEPEAAAEAEAEAEAEQ